MLQNSMQNPPGILDTTLITNVHCQTLDDNAVSRFTVDYTFRRLQPKTPKTQKI